MDYELLIRCARSMAYIKCKDDSLLLEDVVSSSDEDIRSIFTINGEDTVSRLKRVFLENYNHIYDTDKNEAKESLWCIITEDDASFLDKYVENNFGDNNFLIEEEIKSISSDIVNNVISIMEEESGETGAPIQPAKHIIQTFDKISLPHYAVAAGELYSKMAYVYNKNPKKYEELSRELIKKCNEWMNNSENRIKKLSEKNMIEESWANDFLNSNRKLTNMIKNGGSK